MSEPSEDRYETDRVRKAALESLLTSQGWDILSTICQAQIQMLTNQIVLTPLTQHDQVLAQEFNKGHLTGLRTFLALPKQLVDELAEQLKEIDNGDERASLSSD